jgi:signal transduction histidine kinase
MTIRARLTFWYAAILFVCLVLVASLSSFEFHKITEDKADSREDTEAVLKTILWGGLPAAILGLIGGWFLMHKTLEPIGALTQAVEKIDEDNLRQQLPRSGNGDELDRLTDVFNNMTRRLDESFNRIRDFTLDASHELKTPLTILHGQLETALGNESYQPDQREFLGSQLDEVQRLTRIVDGLSLLAKADAGQVALTKVAVQFDELVRETVADAAILAQAQKIQITEGKLDRVTIEGDRDRLRQLLLNLSENAIKYNRIHGSVTFSLAKTKTHAELEISNSGPGIAARNLASVFDRFYREDAAHNRNIEGCGLGLSVAQWIVRAHNGSISIASEPDKITRVNVRLPI